MNCQVCGFELMQQDTWRNADDEQRASWRAHGCAPLATKDKCRNCYQRAYRRTLGCVRPELQEAS
jgi:hypothetical protein